MKFSKLERWATVRHFRLCVALDEYKSILHASKSMNVSQPTASKMLQELEESIGVQLFKRNRRGIEPTQIGLAFIDRSKVILAHLEKVSEEIEALDKGYEGHISIGVTLTGSSYKLQKAIKRFMESHSNVKISLVEGLSSELMSRLTSGEFDFLIGRLSDIELNRDVNQEPLITENAVIVTGKNNPFSKRDDLTLEELAAQRWVIPNAETHLTKKFNLMFIEEGIEPPSPVIETVSLFNIFWMLRETELFGILPQSVATDPAHESDFHIIPSIEPLELSKIGVTKMRGKELSKPCLALLDHLKQLIYCDIFE